MEQTKALEWFLLKLRKDLEDMKAEAIIDVRFATRDSLHPLVRTGGRISQLESVLDLGKECARDPHAFSRKYMGEA